MVVAMFIICPKRSNIIEHRTMLSGGENGQMPCIERKWHADAIYIGMRWSTKQLLIVIYLRLI